MNTFFKIKTAQELFLINTSEIISIIAQDKEKIISINCKNHMDSFKLKFDNLENYNDSKNSIMISSRLNDTFVQR